VFSVRLNKCFWSDESGNATIEAVIWTPIFVLVLAVTMNISMIYFNQAKYLRVIQDANRAYATGRLASLDATESYVTTYLESDSEQLVVSASETDGVVTTQVSVPLTDLVPMSTLDQYFSGKNLTLTAHQLVEN
jgi:Flp pilus assembly protein TadG